MVGRDGFPSPSWNARRSRKPAVENANEELATPHNHTEPSYARDGITLCFADDGPDSGEGSIESIPAFRLRPSHIAAGLHERATVEPRQRRRAARRPPLQ